MDQCCFSMTALATLAIAIFCLVSQTFSLVIVLKGFSFS